MRHPMLMVVLLATVGVVGCDSLFGPQAEAHLGVIGPNALQIEASDRVDVESLERVRLEDVPTQLAESSYPYNPILEAPDTVQAGERFTVRVRTSWDDSCLRQSATDIYEGPGIRVIIPWDFDEAHVDRNVGCAQTPVNLTRELSFEFENPGVAVIEVRGRRFNDEPDVDPRYHAAKEIVVR